MSVLVRDCGMERRMSFERLWVSMYEDWMQWSGGLSGKDDLVRFSA